MDVFMSSFGTIDVQSEHFLIHFELNTGSMENPDDEEEEIENWKSIYTPIIENLAVMLDERLNQFVNIHKGITLAAYDDKLPELWEESTSSFDIPNFIEQGNGNCIYKMRFFPFIFGDMMTVGISLSYLPEQKDRKNLKAYLSESINTFIEKKGSESPIF